MLILKKNRVNKNKGSFFGFSKGSNVTSCLRPKFTMLVQYRVFSHFRCCEELSVYRSDLIRLLYQLPSIVNKRASGIFLE